ncbi:MAG: type II toxin-antitoxin system prevent-host-death family antitoxin [Treponema sp.]|nr:type II toxin-antitoxin system prevent-host-death family antitoxin [Treponema sp.]
MQSIPIFEAKNKLPLYIHMVEQGESFEITRHGKPVAYLVSKDEKKKNPKLTNLN